MLKMLRARAPQALLIVPVVAFAGATTALAGCGSSSSPAAQPSASASGKSTWVIGNVGTYSGENFSPFAGGGQTLQAWASWTNAHGGINGHDVKVITLDDAGVASNSVQDVKQLIQQDHVLAIVGQASGVEANWGAYAQSSGVPVIGGSTPEPDYFLKSDFFPTGATANNSVVDLLSYAKSQLHQTVGGFMYCVEAPVCAQLVPVYQGAYKAIGGKLAYTASYSATQPSYAAECLAAKKAGVQDLEIAGPTPTIVKISQDCASLGYHPTLLLNSVVLTPDLAKQLGAAKSIWEADQFPFPDSTGPAADFQAALKQYQPTVTNPADFTEMDANDWVSGQVFAAAARAANLGNDPTSAELKAGLYKLQAYTAGGLAPPLTYNSGKPNSVNCIFIMAIHKGTISNPQGLKPYCPAS